MLRSKKKISKRELKEDKLVTWYVNVTTWYEKHKKNISIAITVLVLAIVATVVFIKNRSDNNERAMAQLGDVYALFDSGQYQAAIDGIPERNIPGLKSIVENYGSSPSGELARFYLANAYYQMGRYDEALRQFEDFTASDEMLTVSRYAAMAGCFEAKGAFKEAAENFEKAATKYAKDVNAAENLNNAARNFGLVGDKEKAIELYKRLKKNYPTSVYAREADRFIMQLSV
jgi:TolA-binding protein